MHRGHIFVGQAGWALSQAYRPAFPGSGTHLERYARQLPGVEINSSFYRPHRPATYERWAGSTPPGFRFAVKMPRQITHTARLAGADAALERFLAEAMALGDRLGPLLVQLPPSLALDPAVAAEFFAGLRARFAGQIVCEPRHPSWFTDAGETLLADYQVSRVAADPPPCPRADQALAGGSGIVYYRLHGSPVMYHSKYGDDVLAAVAARMERQAEAGNDAWCILDNTASGAALGDALALARRLGLVEAVEPLQERADAELNPEP